jgi:hypothetical protein
MDVAFARLGVLQEAGGSGAKKKERRIQGRSSNPDQGAPTNSTWPAPQTGRWSKHCFVGSRAGRPRLVVFEEAELDARASFKLSIQPSTDGWRSLTTAVGLHWHAGFHPATSRGESPASLRMLSYVSTGRRAFRAFLPVGERLSVPRGMLGVGTPVVASEALRRGASWVAPPESGRVAVQATKTRCRASDRLSCGTQEPHRARRIAKPCRLWMHSAWRRLPLGGANGNHEPHPGVLRWITTGCSRNC